MFCPGCGSKNSIDQRFCRNCGLNLEASAQSLVSQVPEGDRAALEISERRLEKFGEFAFGGLMVVVSSGVLVMLYAVLERMVLSGEQPWTGILLMAFLIFATLTLAYVAFRESLKEKRKSMGIRPVSIPGIESAPVTGRLLEERPFDSVPSAIEDTTSLLPQDRTRRS